jgi:hypothetical protein
MSLVGVLLSVLAGLASVVTGDGVASNADWLPLVDVDSVITQPTVTLCSFLNLRVATDAYTSVTVYPFRGTYVLSTTSFSDVRASTANEVATLITCHAYGVVAFFPGHVDRYDWNNCTDVDDPTMPATCGFVMGASTDFAALALRPAINTTWLSVHVVRTAPFLAVVGYSNSSSADTTRVSGSFYAVYETQDSTRLYTGEFTDNNTALVMHPFSLGITDVGPISSLSAGMLGTGIVGMYTESINATGSSPCGTVSGYLDSSATTTATFYHVYIHGVTPAVPVGFYVSTQGPGNLGYTNVKAITLPRYDSTAYRAVMYLSRVYGSKQRIFFVAQRAQPSPQQTQTIRVLHCAINLAVPLSTPSCANDEPWTPFTYTPWLVNWFFNAWRTEPYHAMVPEGTDIDLVLRGGGNVLVFPGYGNYTPVPGLGMNLSYVDLETLVPWQRHNRNSMTGKTRPPPPPRPSLTIRSLAAQANVCRFSGSVHPIATGSERPRVLVCVGQRVRSDGTRALVGRRRPCGPRRTDRTRLDAHPRGRRASQRRSGRLDSFPRRERVVDGV